MVVGITGGIACGKSKVGKVFERMGARIIEADALGWEVLEQEEIKEEVVEAFGREFLGPDEKIDRKRLGNSLFGHRERLARFNAIVHPPLLTTLRDRIEEAKGSRVSTGKMPGLLAVIATLIVEWKIEDWFDSIISVTSPTEMQIKRLIEKGLTREEANDRIEAQLPQSIRVKSAEFILRNDGSLRDLDVKARAIYEILRKRTLHQ